MGDIASVDDEAVGRACRVVHQGLTEVFSSYLKVEAIRSENEGEMLTIRSSDDRSEYQIIGELSDDSSNDLSVRLIHKGWKLEEINLPKRNANSKHAVKILQACEVEV